MRPQRCLMPPAPRPPTLPHTNNVQSVRSHKLLSCNSKLMQPCQSACCTKVPSAPLQAWLLSFCTPVAWLVSPGPLLHWMMRKQ